MYLQRAINHVPSVPTFNICTFTLHHLYLLYPIFCSLINIISSILYVYLYAYPDCTSICTSMPSQLEFLPSIRDSQWPCHWHVYYADVVYHFTKTELKLAFELESTYIFNLMWVRFRIFKVWLLPRCSLVHQLTRQHCLNWQWPEGELYNMLIMLL